jgi:hypothetical protein
MTQVFLTGMLRSGTTLLDKILDGLNYSRVLTQPFPFFFRQAKERFHDSITYKGDKYLLNDYFFEKKYTLDDVTEYLSTMQFTYPEIENVFEKMKGYSGNYEDTSFLLNSLERKDYHFSELFNVFMDKLANCQNKEMQLSGFKEVQCEEFIPSFISNGWKTVLILRNPYDVITSIQFGKGNQYTGKKRPTLFHLRNWRKSADMAILFSQYDNFHLSKYEDLLLSPNKTLKKLFEFLDISLSDSEIEIIINENLKNWQGNSSFDTNQQGINKNAYGRYKEKMPNPMQQYISKLCEPELNYFDYDVLHNPDFDLQQFREPFAIDQDDFFHVQDYSYNADNINKELFRLELLQKEETDEKTLTSVFIAPFVYNQLKAY